MGEPRTPYKVVVWSTGTVGRHAITGIDAHPDLELVGVWVSNPAKDGKDAGELAELGRELGVLATTDRDALIALKPDCIVHTAKMAAGGPCPPSASRTQYFTRTTADHGNCWRLSYRPSCPKTNSAFCSH